MISSVPHVKVKDLLNPPPTPRRRITLNVARSVTRSAGALLAIALMAAPAKSQVNFLGPGSFTPAAPVVTFSEFALGTVNPHYSFLGIPGLGDVSLDFGGAFVGQTTGPIYAGGPIGISGSPTGPLALDPSSPQTYITTDGASPDSPILSGTPQYNGPISILFSTPVAAVGLTGGYFDAIHSTYLEAFDVNGNSLGSVYNTQTGLEFFGAVTQSGLNEIAGVSFHITASEPAGFGIDNLTFGSGQQVVGVPEPASLLLLIPGILGMAMFRRREREGELQLG
jgi:hypothetical protein